METRRFRILTYEEALASPRVRMSNTSNETKCIIAEGYGGINYRWRTRRVPELHTEYHTMSAPEAGRTPTSIWTLIRVGYTLDFPEYLLEEEGAMPGMMELLRGTI